MVVIAGKYKGLKLKTLDGMNTRPTSARVKEDLFNILDNYFIFENKISLDLFGGTGALSLEGLSRGIKFAYVNDHYAPAIKIIEQNFARVEKGSYKISMKDYLVLLNEFEVKKVKVDLIYLDPPFPHLEYYYEVLEKLKTANLLNDWGVVAVEAPEPLELSHIDYLTLLKSKVYKTKVNKYLYIFRLETGA